MTWLAARYTETPKGLVAEEPKRFETFEGAMSYIAGSPVKSPRPWIFNEQTRKFIKIGLEEMTHAREDGGKVVGYPTGICTDYVRVLFDCTGQKRINWHKPVLYDYETSRALRNATRGELQKSMEAAEHDGGCGVIEVDGRDCYVVE